ncbi:uncharacterized protein LOC127648798 isoform X2 [Xyrauchen texanus]|nr:uncharacterized protein LOC127648798 isoform X2 [Xyrauchen texanus]
MAASSNTLFKLLRDVADQLESSAASSSSSPEPSTSSDSRLMTPRHPVDTEVARLFSPYNRGRGLARRTSLPVMSRAVSCSFTHIFCCLDDKNAVLVPSRCAKERLFSAGLGEKRVTFRGCHTDPQKFKDVIMEAFPKLRQGGGFELLKISGNTRSRHLSLIPCPNEGYHVKYLKDPQNQIGHSTIFIRPLQRNLEVESTSHPNRDELIGPPQKCVVCGDEFPFAEIKCHSDECMRSAEVSGEVVSERATQSATSSNTESRIVRQERNVSSASVRDRAMQVQGNHVSQVITIDCEEGTELDDWKFEPDPTEALKKYREIILRKHETGKELSLQMDMRESPEDRERAILTFYKTANVEWACPLKCTLHGDPAIGDGVTRHVFATIMSKLQHGFELQLVPGGTLLFEGEKDHLIPSTSQCLLDSDFFVVAGRMIGHSFLHGGPCLTGLSPAIVHVLFGGSPETATIDVLDCADIDVRQVIKMLEGTGELSLEEKSAITDLAVSWDLPGVTSENRRWLLEKLLIHAVLERTCKQAKQLRRGLKETLIWPLLTERKDTIPLLFPRTSDTLYTPLMILERIHWPTEDEDSEVSIEETCRLTGFLRTFIEN